MGGAAGPNEAGSWAHRLRGIKSGVTDDGTTEAVATRIGVAAAGHNELGARGNATGSVHESETIEDKVGDPKKGW